MRLILAILLLLVPLTASAQTRDSMFDDYAAYDSFVDSHVKQRDFVALVQRLGGRDEYTPEQLAATNVQLLTAFPADFENGAVFNKVDLGNGFSQEARAFWNTNGGYAFYFAFLHQRDDALVVLRFTLNSSSARIMEQF